MLKRKRAKTGPAVQPATGTEKTRLFTPGPSGAFVKTCSPGSAKSPSPLKSMKALSQPGAEAVTSTVEKPPHTTGEVKTTPSSSSVPSSRSSPSALAVG